MKYKEVGFCGVLEEVWREMMQKHGERKGGESVGKWLMTRREKGRVGDRAVVCCGVLLQVQSKGTSVNVALKFFQGKSWNCEPHPLSNHDLDVESPGDGGQGHQSRHELHGDRG